MPDASAPIRDAATLILIRDPGPAPSVLMGQRGAQAAFMPNKFVFPGGAMDQTDADVPLTAPLPQICRARIQEDSDASVADALPATAIRELWEETGLALGRPAAWENPPEGWQDFAAAGFAPDASGLRFVFRAITPPGRSRRFDARFFLADAAVLAGDPDDFSRASDELSHLQWIPLSDVRRFDMPFITEVVLAEISALASAPSQAPASVPFFRNDEEESLFLRLGRRA